MLILLSLSSVFGEDPFQKCNQSGLCLGHLIEVQESEFNSIYDCVYRCKEVSGCKFVSFHSKHKTCTLSRACRTVVLKESDYMHSSVNCDQKILIVGGWQSEDSFIITGGYGMGIYTGYAQIADETKLWTLPEYLTEHCMEQINATSYILIGGYSRTMTNHYSKKTFLFTPKENGT